MSRDTVSAAPINSGADSSRAVRVTALPNIMAVTQSRSTDLRRQQQKQQEHDQEPFGQQKGTAHELLLPSSKASMALATPDPRRLPQVFDGVTYAAPNSYDGVRPDDPRAIAENPWYSRAVVHADAENYF